MRVTENMTSFQVLRDLSSLRQKHAKASEEATSGMAINRPSDDPTAAARMQRVQRAIGSSEAMNSALSMGRTDLELAEASLAEAGNLMQRAKEVAMHAANGSSSADVRQSAAEEIKGIRTALLGIANTKGVRGYLFAGSQTNQPAFDNAYVYQGDNFQHSIRSGPTSEVVISTSGLQAFTAAGGTNIFQDLETLELDLNANNQAGISASLTALDTGHEQIVLERARTGVNMTRVEQAQNILTNSKFLYERQQTDVGGADPAKSFTNLSALQNAIERSISVSSQLLNMDAFTLL
jgi:flagellar hook-associated protein 3 FlgL